MKTLVTFQVFITLVFLSTYQEQVSSQSFYPNYGGVPVIYDNSEDDDIGLLLTVLLLAARNRNGNCNRCNCCNCGNSAKSIPIPYPIPFPTNNPIISNPQPVYINQNDDGYDNEEDEDDDNNEVDYKEHMDTVMIKPGLKYDKNTTIKFKPTPVVPLDEYDN